MSGSSTDRNVLASVHPYRRRRPSFSWWSFRNASTSSTQNWALSSAMGSRPPLDGPEARSIASPDRSGSPPLPGSGLQALAATGQMVPRDDRSVVRALAELRFEREPPALAFGHA